MQYTLDRDTDTVKAEMPLAEFQKLLRIVTASGQQDFDILVRHSTPDALVSRVFHIGSQRSATKSYEVHLDIMGEWVVSTSCVCEDYMYRHAKGGTDCKHIGRARVLLARENGALIS
jgi:hypothetical protein